jgi:phosphohistidine phosphatase
MRTLYLLRHAKSSWDDPELPDRERPLAPRGVRDAKRIARHMRRLEIAPGLVLCSPAVRARQTLEPIEAKVPDAPVDVDERLYSASSETLLERVRAIPDEVASVLLIGHNPGVQELALLLASRGDELERLEAKFPTAALATLSLARWSSLRVGDAELSAYVVPKQLR